MQHSGFKTKKSSHFVQHSGFKTKKSSHFVQHSGFKTKKIFTFCATRWVKTKTNVQNLENSPNSQFSEIDNSRGVLSNLINYLLKIVTANVKFWCKCAAIALANVNLFLLSLLNFQWICQTRVCMNTKFCQTCQIRIYVMVNISFQNFLNLHSLNSHKSCHCLNLPHCDARRKFYSNLLLSAQSYAQWGGKVARHSFSNYNF
jgi:hypothetical protein